MQESEPQKTKDGINELIDSAFSETPLGRTYGRLQESLKSTQWSKLPNNIFTRFRGIDRKAGGHIHIQQTQQSSQEDIEVIAELPPTPKFKSYRLEWRLGIDDPKRQRLLIDGIEQETDKPFHSERNFFTDDDISSLNDVLDKVSEDEKQG